MDKMKMSTFLVVCMIFMMCFWSFRVDAAAMESDDEILTLDKTKTHYVFDCYKRSGAVHLMLDLDVVYSSNYSVVFYFDYQYSFLGLMYSDGNNLNLVKISPINGTSSVSLDNGNINIMLNAYTLKTPSSNFSSDVFDSFIYQSWDVIYSNKPFVVSYNGYMRAYNKDTNKMILQSNDRKELFNACMLYSGDLPKFETFCPELIDSTYLGNSVSFNFNYDLAKAEGYRPSKIVLDSLYIDFVGHNSKGLKTMQISKDDVSSCVTSIDKYIINIDLYDLCKILAIYNSDSESIKNGKFDIRDVVNSDNLIFDENSTIEAVTIYCHYEYSGSYKSKVCGFTQETKHNIYTSDNLTLTTTEVEQKPQQTEVVVPVENKIYTPIDNDVFVYPPDVKVEINQGDTNIIVPGGGSSGGSSSDHDYSLYPSDVALDWTYFDDAIHSVKDGTLIFANWLSSLFGSVFGAKFAVVISFALGGVVIARFLGR